MSYGGDGRVDGVLTRMLSIARKQQRLPELRAEVEAALAKRPDWVGGKALLAVIDIQTGNKEAGKKLWQEVFADPKADIPPLARFILTQELEFYAGVEDMAVKTLEAGIDEMMKDGNYEFSYSPGPPAGLVVRATRPQGRRQEAACCGSPRPSRSTPATAAGTGSTASCQNRLAVAQELQRTGDPIEAVRALQPAARRQGHARPGQPVLRRRAVRPAGRAGAAGRRSRRSSRRRCRRRSARC